MEEDEKDVIFCTTSCVADTAPTLFADQDRGEYVVRYADQDARSTSTMKSEKFLAFRRRNAPSKSCREKSPKNRANNNTPSASVETFHFPKINISPPRQENCPHPTHSAVQTTALLSRPQQELSCRSHVFPQCILLLLNPRVPRIPVTRAPKPPTTSMEPSPAYSRRVHPCNRRPRTSVTPP